MRMMMMRAQAVGNERGAEVTVLVTELRDALVEADAAAEKADAEVVLPLSHAATSNDPVDLGHDLHLTIERVKSSLVMWFAGTMIAHGLAVVVATVTPIKLLPG